MVAIIALLLSILTPALNAVKVRARRILCSNHLIRNRPVGGNVLFLDGHLKWQDFKEMEYRNDWNPYHWW